MTLPINIRRSSVVLSLIGIVLLSLLATAGAQSRSNGSAAGDNNGVPQQIAALRAQLAQANAATAELQAAVGALETANMALQQNINNEAADREAADTQLRTAIGAIHLPQYLIDLGDTLDVPSENVVAP